MNARLGSLFNSSPSSLAFYLKAKGSLTALLEQLAGQPLKVVIEFEGFRKLSIAEKKQLQFQAGLFNRPVMAWVRQVKLYGDDEVPWVSAQSIFPLMSLQGDAKRLKYLKNMPVGYVLFKRQNVLPNRRLIVETQKGWQRQTCYDWYGRSLLIVETFLPAFQKYLLHVR